MKTITLKLPVETDLKLERAAARLKKTKSVLVRLAIQELLERPDIASKLSAFELLAEHCGVLRGLPKTLSTLGSHLDGYGLDACGE